MREVDDGLEIKPLKEREIQLVTVSRAAEIIFYHAIVAWWYKVRHGFSRVCLAAQNLVELELIAQNRSRFWISNNSLPDTPNGVINSLVLQRRFCS